jgi:hypothetical protein
MRAQSLFQFLTVKLWIDPAVRFGAYIADRCDAMTEQELYKALLRMR